MKQACAIEVLRTLRPLLEARGIVRAGLFGSIGRDMAGSRSDIDVVVTPAADRRLNLFDLGGIQTVLEEGFAGMEVDVVAEPIRQPELKAAVERDRVDAFLSGSRNALAICSARSNSLRSGLTSPAAQTKRSVVT